MMTSLTTLKTHRLICHPEDALLPALPEDALLLTLELCRANGVDACLGGIWWLV